MEKLEIGSRVPGFTLKDQDGKLFDLNNALGRKNLVIYFYPKDETAGCTAQACSFRDDYEEFLQLNAEVIGISSDSPESHRNFAQKHRLPFILLSDPDQSVRKKFGVPGSLMGLIPGRTTYIVDKEGNIRHIFTSQLGVKKHVEIALNVIRELTEN